MSDHKYGEPVEDTSAPRDATSAAEAVASAREGLADAEAATRDVVPDETTVAEPAVDAPVEPVVDELSAPAPAGSLYADDPVDETYVPGAYSSDDADTVVAPTAVVAPAASDVAPTEVVAPAIVAPDLAAPAPAPQPIFVQAPEAPRPRGNRGAAALIGLLAAVSFAVLYLAAALGLRAFDGDVTGANLGTEALAALSTWWFWVPVVVFYIAFWLLGAIINRGRWGHWVIFGIFVGVAAYGGHILGQLFQAPFWELTAREGADLARGQLLSPLAIVAFVLGRELTVWFGAWVAARGKRVAELNREAQREYERTLEAGPRLHQS
ncbi:ABC transporter [Microbacterium dextranolyticum]|uniref:Uncharacterized protein n=1 Tax=Microbacterium dextranolyticum TaxID=36806 RepID=A0A9W6HJR1_9MICO|nr:ABC transporter [Microbacterium dextranolyticum]MBM7462010.1 hypothetical protein [Microbacterium dextranolyticum]GLJ94253.1 hypothetical protein GCM10017591_03140 [Microbacterium dextranolyticum]